VYTKLTPLYTMWMKCRRSAPCSSAERGGNGTAGDDAKTGGAVRAEQSPTARQPRLRPGAGVRRVAPAAERDGSDGAAGAFSAVQSKFPQPRQLGGELLTRVGMGFLRLIRETPYLFLAGNRIYSLMAVEMIGVKGLDLPNGAH